MIQSLFIAKSQGVCWEHWDWPVMEQGMGRACVVLLILFSFSTWSRKSGPENPPDPRGKHPAATAFQVDVLSSPCSAPSSPARLYAAFSTHAGSCHSNRWFPVKVTGPGLSLLAAVFCPSWWNYSWNRGRKQLPKWVEGTLGGYLQTLCACLCTHRYDHHKWDLPFSPS